MKTFENMVMNAPKDKKIMWASVTSISNLFNELWKANPHLARKYLFEQRAIMYEPHYDEELAKEEVYYMSHIDNGEPVRGELIPMEDVLKYLPTDRPDINKYDAYVGFNGFAHDLAHAKMDMKSIMMAALSFWFMDDDFKSGDSKVWWYYKNL